MDNISDSRFTFQVYDIDGDGVDEVIMARNFELMILDGKPEKF